MYGEVEVQTSAFLTSAVDGVSDQVHATAASAPAKNHDTHLIFHRGLGGPQFRSGCCVED